MSLLFARERGVVLLEELHWLVTRLAGAESQDEQVTMELPAASKSLNS